MKPMCVCMMKFAIAPAIKPRMIDQMMCSIQVFRLSYGATLSVISSRQMKGCRCPLEVYNLQATVSRSARPELRNTSTGGRRRKPFDALRLAHGRPFDALRLAHGRPFDALRLAHGRPFDALRLAHSRPFDALRLAHGRPFDALRLARGGPFDALRLAHGRRAQPPESRGDVHRLEC